MKTACAKFWLGFEIQNPSCTAFHFSSRNQLKRGFLNRLADTLVTVDGNQRPATVQHPRDSKITPFYLEYQGFPNISGTEPAPVELG
jgi:hypothetical protein